MGSATEAPTTVALLQEVLDALPRPHEERAGLIRAIELLRHEPTVQARASAARVRRFLEAWDVLRRGGLHTDLIYSVGAFPAEDDPRTLTTGDLTVLADAVEAQP